MKITQLIQNSESGDSSHIEQFALDVMTGLCSRPKTLAPKYFYDDKGSEIFQKITQHQDYYLARTEFKILQEMKAVLPEIINAKEIDLIELGAGDGHKSQLLIEGFLEHGVIVNYYPIDISEQAMKLLEVNIKPHTNLQVHGVVAEYFEGLKFVRKASSNIKLALFLGSNIGNFNRVQNQGFLRGLWRNLNSSDYSLIGFDLKKDLNMLQAAYNDSAGHTKEFNLNLLRRLNRELGANFDPDKFQHYGIYNPVLGAMESHLLAKVDHQVYVAELERSFHFEAFEPIHIEYSFKFLKSDIDYLGKQTGFSIKEHFTDPKNHFIDSLWQVVKHTSTSADPKGAGLEKQ